MSDAIILTIINYEKYKRKYFFQQKQGTYF